MWWPLRLLTTWKASELHPTRNCQWQIHPAEQPGTATTTNNPRAMQSKAYDSLEVVTGEEAGTRTQSQTNRDTRFESNYSSIMPLTTLAQYKTNWGAHWTLWSEAGKRKRLRKQRPESTAGMKPIFTSKHRIYTMQMTPKLPGMLQNRNDPPGTQQTKTEFNEQHIHKTPPPHSSNYCGTNLKPM